VREKKRKNDLLCNPAAAHNQPTSSLLSPQKMGLQQFGRLNRPDGIPSRHRPTTIQYRVKYKKKKKNKKERNTRRSFLFLFCFVFPHCIFHA
jgi:hypothetical protein